MRMLLAIGLASILTLFAPDRLRAEWWAETINGAACIPTPPSGEGVPTGGVAAWYLIGFSPGVAYCQVSIPNGWQLDQLSYVLFDGQIYGGRDSLSVRLCVYSTPWSVGCGPEKVVRQGYFVDWVALPGTLPPYPRGAYLRLAFGTGQTATSYYTLNYVMPVLLR